VSTWVVILAGGVGSRFWPLSTPERPKQFLPLVTEQPLLVDTLQRMAAIAGSPRTLVLTSGSLAPGIHRLAPSVPAENVIVEPRPAGTAAALAWAASIIASRGGEESVMISVHADWAIGDDEKYRATLQRAASVAASRRALVTVGVVPRRPDPGLGHIRPGTAVEDGVFEVAQFVEKPDRERAVAMTREGWLWNSGIFAWRVDDFLSEIRAHTPEVSVALDSSGGDAQRFFASVKSVAVDVGVLERSRRVLVVPGDFGWDDVGTWSALRRVRRLDGEGNAVHGSVHAVQSRGNVVHAESGTVVLFGVSDLVVVTHGKLTLVTTVDRALELKQLVESLPAEVRSIA
jgi:mannose-1-phosphate guanylyltransferase